MFKANHIDDYIISDDGDIILDAKNHRRLDERYVGTKYLRLNLEEGYKGECDERLLENFLQVFLKYLIAQSPNGLKTLTEVLYGSEFVCGRGALKKIGSAHEREKLRLKNDWIMICERWNNVIFMQQTFTDKDEEERQAMTEWDKLRTYMGKRFERYMTRPSQHSNDYDLRMVMVSTISDDSSENPIKVMYSGEIDAVDSDGKFVELKTLKKPRYGEPWLTPSRSVDWWLQSKLLNVDYLVVGIINGNIVRQTKKIELSDMENINWSSACFSHLHEFLAHVKNLLGNNSACRVTFKNGNFHYELISCGEAAVVPEYFKQHFMDRNFNLTDMEPHLLKKIITKLDPKSYFRMQQTCRAMDEFIRKNK